ncbi:hypothetical protein ACSQ67_006305 [Phaseolus vulgaris]
MLCPRPGSFHPPQLNHQNKESEDELWDAKNAKIKTTTVLNNNQINFGGGLMNRKMNYGMRENAKIKKTTMLNNNRINFGGGLMIPEEMELDYLPDFEDYFPSMIARMGAEGFIGELCNGFRLLMDVNKGLITFESLKINCYLLGLDVRDDELVGMLMEGDLDGDGALSQMEFCILMFRLSPCLMDSPKMCSTQVGADPMLI